MAQKRESKKQRHPAGSAVGAAGAGAAGALAGAAFAGPPGAIVGALAGAAAGAVAGNAFTSEFDANEEARYWRETFASRPYWKRDRDFSFYEPAYRYGWESARRHTGDPRCFEDVEPELAGGWLSWMAGDSSPAHEWHEAREAVRDAWRRIRGD